MLRKTIIAIVIVLTIGFSQSINSKDDQPRLSPKLLNYQGFITDTLGNPITNPAVSVTFGIWTSSGGGTQLWYETQPISVAKGIFNVLLGNITPIPDSVFTKGTDRWLELTYAGITLIPRTRIVSVGYAVTASYSDTTLYARTLQGKDTLAFDTRYVNEAQVDAILTPMIKDTAVTMVKIARAGAASGQVVKWNGSAWQPSSDLTSADNHWGYLITDGADTTLQMGGRWGLARYGNTLYGSADSTHVNFGVACTTGTSGQNYKYATVAGGLQNKAGNDYSTVGGGDINVASGAYATVAGGFSDTASGPFAFTGSGYGNNAGGNCGTVSGGGQNKTGADLATVAGGRWNTANGWASGIGGGDQNSAPGYIAYIGGGIADTATGAYTFIGAGWNNNANADVATVAGGLSNQATAWGATVGGGSGNIASGGSSFIGGGGGNLAGGSCATVSGGNANLTASDYATIAGGYKNMANGLYSGILSGDSNQAGTGSTDMYAAVVGGYHNRARSKYSYIGGGYKNMAYGYGAGVLSGDSNQTGTLYASGDSCATVAGGKHNKARNSFSFVGGGGYNTACSTYTVVGGGNSNGANGDYCVVGGGSYNASFGAYSFIGGGGANWTLGDLSSVGGGYENVTYSDFSTISGGWGNNAGQVHEDSFAVVAGGDYNKASGKYSFVGGGRNNNAMIYSTVSGGAYNTSGADYATVPGGWADSAMGTYTFAVGNHSVAPATCSNSAAFNGQVTTAPGQTRVNILAKATGSFTIDHPLDPDNKILNHYFVESPDMSNMYSGSVVLDASGRAAVDLPDYFDALNKSPRVQLTGVGSSDVYVAEDFNGDRFVIGGKPGMKVYWTVVADRKDPSAEATRLLMPVEQPKTGELAGRSLDDNFLVSTMAQLEKMGYGDRFQFRYATDRQRYEDSKKMVNK